MTDPTLTDLIAQIHATPIKLVMEFAGAGSMALAWLHSIPGSSQTILEATDRYAKESLSDLLGAPPENFVSREVAQAMAHQAYRRAMRLSDGNSACIGIGCTAAIATGRIKRGDHHCWVAIRNQDLLKTYGLTFAKGLRDRQGEEELVSRLILQAIAALAGLPTTDLVTLTPQEQITTSEQAANDPIVQLLAGTVASVLVDRHGQLLANHPFSGALLSGSFNPLHIGHERLLQAAETLLNRPGIFELPVINADKPALGYTEIERRLAPFRWRYNVMLTRTPLFRDKALLFPNSIFAVGYDTAARLVEPHYYGGLNERDRALGDIRAYGCSFLVAGRLHDGRFQTLADLKPPSAFADLFRPLPENLFRVDLSSTEIRVKN